MPKCESYESRKKYKGLMYGQILSIIIMGL